MRFVVVFVFVCLFWWFACYVDLVAIGCGCYVVAVGGFDLIVLISSFLILILLFVGYCSLSAWLLVLLITWVVVLMCLCSLFRCCLGFARWVLVDVGLLLWGYLVAVVYLSCCAVVLLDWCLVVACVVLFVG